MIDFVWPYKLVHAEDVNGVQFSELRYSMNSVVKHFKGDFRLNVYTDHKIDFPIDVPVRQIIVNPGTGKHDDVSKKMDRIIHDHRISDDFILMTDDEFILQDVGIDDFPTDVAKGTRVDHGQTMAEWKTWMNDTFKALDDWGKGPFYNFETHIPRKFNRELLKDIKRRFRPRQNRLLMATLYFNVIRAGMTEPPRFLGETNYRAAFFGDELTEYIKGVGTVKRITEDSLEGTKKNLKKIEDEKRMFMVTTEIGLNPVLKNYIIKRFSIDNN